MISLVLKELQSATKSWFASLGILVSGVTLAGLIGDIFSIEWSAIVKNLIGVFREIFHTPINWVLKLMHIELPVFVKDCIIAYMALAGASIRMEKRLLDGYRFVSSGDEGLMALKSQKTKRYVYYLFMFLIWPIHILKSFRYPLVYEFEYNTDVYFPHFYSSHAEASKFLKNYKPASRDYPIYPSLEFIFDKRAVFLSQLLGMVIALLFILAVNYSTGK